MDDSMRIASLSEYALPGRSGLRVSPLCLGTMTFGRAWGWGIPEETAARIFDRYVDAGGNFIDTADGYTGGAATSSPACGAMLTGGTTVRVEPIWYRR